MVKLMSLYIVSLKVQNLLMLRLRIMLYPEYFPISSSRKISGKHFLQWLLTHRYPLFSPSLWEPLAPLPVSVG